MALSKWEETVTIPSGPVRSGVGIATPDQAGGEGHRTGGRRPGSLEVELSL
jgi:hypothetical protein